MSIRNHPEYGITGLATIKMEGGYKHPNDMYGLIPNTPEYDNQFTLYINQFRKESDTCINCLGSGCSYCEEEDYS